MLMADQASARDHHRSGGGRLARRRGRRGDLHEDRVVDLDVDEDQPRLEDDGSDRHHRDEHDAEAAEHPRPATTPPPGRCRWLRMTGHGGDPTSAARHVTRTLGRMDDSRAASGHWWRRGTTGSDHLDSPVVTSTGAHATGIATVTDGGSTP